MTPFFISAQTLNFYTDSDYHLQSKEEIEAELLRITSTLYFYVEKDWWDNLNSYEQNSIRIATFNLGEEFQNRIYPKLTLAFGSEPKPGIDKDEKITVLIHPMIGDAGGYFRSGDVYSRFQYPESNEREMVYLNGNYIDKKGAESFLAHEFMHLIILNQKELRRGVFEETWLNEARAEVAPTYLGYDRDIKDSNLERRLKAFLEAPNDSLTEWFNARADYGVINLFIQYLVDHNGTKILADSLVSSKNGIASIDEALAKSGFRERFSQIFTDWTITLLVNDCSLGEKYCYKNPNLKKIKIIPESYFIPRSTETSISLYGQIQDWSARWQMFRGGKGDLSLKFIGSERGRFKVSYVLCDLEEKCSLKLLFLNGQQEGQVTIPNFDSQYSSLTIIPSLQNKLSGFGDNDPLYPFSFEVKTKEKGGLGSECLIGRNLYFGIINSDEVRCLQEFLKTQGLSIYPEGLVTGNFLSLTRNAIVRFQEKYKADILAVFGLAKGTGFVGERTRAKIQELLR